MPGVEAKAQHFVQRAYLEAFCDPVPNEKTGASFLWVHTANQKPWRQIPKECAVQNYFYCHEQENGQRSFLGETFLADLEAASSDVLRAAQQGTLPTTLRDRYTLTGYVAMAHVRTPARKRHIDQTAIDHTVQGIRDLVNDPVRFAEYCAEQERETGKPHDPEEQRRILRAGEVRCVQTSRAWSLRRMAELMAHFQEIFMRMNLFLVHAESGLFVTSDNPVRVHDPATVPLLPKGYQSFEMLFPLSRELCLVGSYSKAPARLELDESHVKGLNTGLVRQADRFVYAPFNAGFIQTELKKSFAQKATNQTSDFIKF